MNLVLGKIEFAPSGRIASSNHFERENYIDKQIIEMIVWAIICKSLIKDLDSKAKELNRISSEQNRE